ncbi:aerobic respiration control sensor protein arcB [Tothia fuscella]|uniref:histidine kinase n=1 Tax=Tothia fuscella TaxID=1048955 RepID=A0A9P4P2T0_9PEZI|nr:aerobic respiration control sensor protein arcB [Tothia fuscella]
MDELDPANELDSLGVREVLDQDSRPCFVLDLDPDHDGKSTSANALIPTFCNSALRLHEKLHDAIIGTDASGLPSANDSTTYDEFKSWARSVTKFDDSKDVFPLSVLYGDFLWTGSTVRKRWRLISGNLCWGTNIPLRDLSAGPPGEVATGGMRVEQAKSHNVSLNSARKRTNSKTAPTTMGGTTLVSATQTASKPSYFPKTEGSSSGDTGGSSGAKSTLNLSLPEKAVIDWTADKPRGTLSNHVLFARTIKWASTPLGAMNSWSPEFRQVANLLMANPHPAALFWGSDLTMMYNEAYAIEVAGHKHPALMGTGFQGPFSELWDSVGPVFAECARTGVSVRRENDYLPIERHGFLEETFFSWSFSPLYGGTSRILGFYNGPFEVTRQVIGQRRMTTINKIGEWVARAKTVKRFWKCLIDSLEHNKFDVPFALLYSVGESEEGDHSSISSGSTISLKSCHYEGSLGIPDGHPAAPKQLDLKRSREGFVPSFREAMRTREPTSLHVRDGTLPEGLLEGIEWRGFPDPCEEAIIFPIRPTNGDTVLAFLLIGVNPRRPYDDEYKAFTSMLNRQLATSLASVMLFEDEIRKSRDAAEAAALEQEQLTQQLALQTNRMRRMTELSPLGMFLVTPEGLLSEANDRFFEMTGHSRDDIYEMSWMERVAPGSVKTMEEGWKKMVDGLLPWTGELQLKIPEGRPLDLNLDNEPIEYWVLFTAQPEFANDGSIRSVMGSITDISHLKWAQGLQNKRLQEAEETRRQQNEFIDITSHEMRNPLSAILQCADDISTTLQECSTSASPPSTKVVADCIDAAQTICLCVQHQRTIVDDILTISKLDSNLLVITPIASQPLVVARRAVQVFESELKGKDIGVRFEEHDSLQELEGAWLKMDPSRVLQILINLMTNAIKFTAGAGKRLITVHVGISPEPPRMAYIPDFEYIPTRTTNVPEPTGEDWGTGDIVYLRLKVQDTGCGLTREEKQVLFRKFSQASPRTHAQYGGSGLGLFISRQLAELHGGQVGVASEAGVGSTFGFFIRTRVTDPPAVQIASTPQQVHIHAQEAETRQQFVAPQLQDSAATNPAASLAASIAFAKLDPKTLNILVVEDNLVNQKILVKQLKKVGCSVGVANDGLEALAFLKKTVCMGGKQQLSVILMDLEMPNMDGLTCVREIRKMQNGGVVQGHVPVIAVTANVRDEQVASAKKSGMDDVMGKPFRIPDLLDKIEALLARI